LRMPTKTGNRTAGTGADDVMLGALSGKQQRGRSKMSWIDNVTPSRGPG